MAVGTVDLHFLAAGANVLLDDVSLTPVAVSSTNPTVFRDEVVSTLMALHPGSLRYMDVLPDFGSSLDNMLTPPFGRLRAGSSTQTLEQDDIPIGVVPQHAFLASYYDTDMRLQRVFSVGERIKAVASIEAFNLLNHVNVQNIDQVYGAPDFIGLVPRQYGDNVGSPVNPTFATPNYVSPARQLQASVRISF